MSFRRSVDLGRTELKMTLLNKLPGDVAEEMKWMAWDASWHTANTRKGWTGDATADKIRFEEHATNMHKLSEGLGVSSSTLDHIKWGAWNAAWHTANTRASYTGDASGDLAAYEEHFAAVKRSGEFTSELADNIQWMCWNAAWHCANIRVGYNEDAKADQNRFEHHAKQISGEVNLIDIKFDIDQAKILSLKPKRIAEQELINRSNVEQSQAFKVTYSKGRTNSWNNKVGFKIGTKTSVKAGFSLLAEAKVEVSFEASYEHSWSSSETESETVSYEFPVKVSPHTTVVASAMIQEAQMSVPYEMTLDIGGSVKKISGIWEGVSYSRVSSEFKERPA